MDLNLVELRKIEVHMMLIFGVHTHAQGDLAAKQEYNSLNVFTVSASVYCSVSSLSDCTTRKMKISVGTRYIITRVPDKDLSVSRETLLSLQSNLPRLWTGANSAQSFQQAHIAFGSKSHFE